MSEWELMTERELKRVAIIIEEGRNARLWWEQTGEAAWRAPSGRLWIAVSEVRRWREEGRHIPTESYCFSDVWVVSSHPITPVFRVPSVEDVLRVAAMKGE